MAADLACDVILLENYNLPLHIGAVFIILLSSGLGVGIPLMSGWIKRNDWSTSCHGQCGELWWPRWLLDECILYCKTLWDGDRLVNSFHREHPAGAPAYLLTVYQHLFFHGFVMFQNDCVGELDILARQSSAKTTKEREVMRFWGL